MEKEAYETTQEEEAEDEGEIQVTQSIDDWVVGRALGCGLLEDDQDGLTDVCDDSCPKRLDWNLHWKQHVLVPSSRLDPCCLAFLSLFSSFFVSRVWKWKYKNKMI